MKAFFEPASSYFCHMRRPRRSVPLCIASLHYNPQTKLYEITEEGITYAMPLELTRGLKEYFAWHGPGDRRTMATWFAQLKLDEKDGVQRSGNVPQSPDDFFPDPTYEE